MFALLFWVSELKAREQDLLKSTDISRVMKQILEHHDGVKEVSNRVLQNALIVYIDQFDPNRIYLLESEVKPFIHLSPQQVEETVQNYKKGNFTIFKQLNLVIQKSIERSRNLRQGLEADAKSSLFSSKKEEERFPEYNTFAQTIDELKKRLWQNLKRFIQNQKNRFTDASVMQKKDEVIHSYEARLQEFENEYMGTNEKGTPLPQAEQDNLFTIHVLKALASSLDAHTSFYQANEAYDMRVRLQKEFQGIGLVLKDAQEGAVVTRLLENGPAAKSGLIQAGDILIEVDRKPVADLPFEKVMDLLHDSKESEVTLIFKRPAKSGEREKIFTVKLKREIIVVNNDRVDWSYENFGNGIIGKIVLHSFYQGEGGITSEKDMREAIQKLEGKGNLKGLILDLRDNSGGFLSQAIKVAGLFITNGVVVISKYADGEEKIYRDVDGKIAYDGPLVILTSKVTASAAEIVAQALQDYGVALVVGDEHTYGKGTIQTQTVTDNQSTSYFKVTVGKYYTVSGKTPQKDGVKADIVAPGRWNDEPIGEEYLNSPKADKIQPAYDDDLSDISPDVKSWYLKYYIPKIQHRKNVWRKILPTLKKNSEYRIAHNKNYQFYLKGKVVDDDNVNEEEEELGVVNNNKKNFGEDDLQMQEAVNVVKDMIMLHSLDLDLESRKGH